MAFLCVFLLSMIWKYGYLEYLLFAMRLDALLSVYIINKHDNSHRDGLVFLIGISGSRSSWLYYHGGKISNVNMLLRGHINDANCLDADNALFQSEELQFY